MTKVDVRWKDIPGYPGYRASKDGQILGRRGWILKYAINPENGYKYHSLQVDGKQVQSSLHRLIALTFLGPRPKGVDIRHLNGNKMDCRARNLAYGTRQENMMDASSHGTLKGRARR